MRPVKEPVKTANHNPALAVIFWMVISVFILIGITSTVSYYVLPFREYGKFVFPSILAILLLLSITLLIIAVREKIGGIFGKFLLLTGASAIGTAAGILLQNFLTGTAGEYVFFIVGLIIAPVGFLTGIIGSMVMFIKKRKFG